MTLGKLGLNLALSWLVPARRLRGRALRASDGMIRGASLLPFFDRQGRVQRVMVLVAGSPRIRLLAWRPDLLRATWFGPIPMAAAICEARPISGPLDFRLHGLWHYDPWWMLDDEAYARHPAVPALKAANCAGRLRPDVKMLHFRRDLARVSLVTTSKRGNVSLQRWRADLLPAAQARPMPADRVPGLTPWQLDPIWQQWGCVRTVAQGRRHRSKLI